MALQNKIIVRYSAMPECLNAYELSPEIIYRTVQVLPETLDMPWMFQWKSQ